VQGRSVTTFLFADIEGSTRLWEQDPERMQPALARHDAIARAAVANHRGVLVKNTGDGVHAAFDDPFDAVNATLELQRGVAALEAESGVPLRVRSGLHAGLHERRDNDYFGATVNRAARITGAGHGGQMLLSHAVVVLLADRLPQGVELRDLGSVRLQGLATPEHLFQIIHPEFRRDFPPLRLLEATPNNLPHQVTSFIGREQELEEVERLLAGTRLLTLLGVGGLGKTRLSLQAAADLMSDYPDGVWFVELAALTDGARVVQAVASAIGVKEEAGRPVMEALSRHVKDRRLLVILDNCEHLVQACAELATQLLHAGPQVKILASSREHLRVSGETVCPVHSLTVPGLEQRLSTSALLQFEAVRLFVERARAAQSGFQLTDKNAGLVADICRRVDGIPLALELAAACVRTLSVERIATRLDDRFALLRGGDRTALPRQQTLRALIDWSFDLLEPNEQVLFRRCSVFAGSFTLESAEAVCAGGDIETQQVFGLLAQLVDKSLVAVDNDVERYRMLETIRHYAGARLDDADEAETLRARHLAHFLEFAERVRPELIGEHQGTWLARLDLERENILAAHGWAAQAPDGAQQGLRLISAVKHYWMNRGLLGLGYRVTVEALTRPGTGVRNEARCQTLFDGGQIAVYMGRYADAQVHLEESLAIARELRDRNGIARILQPLAMAAHGKGDAKQALAHLGEALALAQEVGDRRQIAGALIGLAQVHRVEGDLEQSARLYEQMLVVARELGDKDALAVGLLNLAMVAITVGDAQRARALLMEVVAIAEEIGSKQAWQSGLDVCTGLAVLLGDFDGAATFFGAAEALAIQTGIQRDPTDSAFLLPLVERARAALGGQSFAATAESGGALTYAETLQQARDWLASRA
jgi:predicted ATPase/class 3 adenylate cyclase